MDEFERAKLLADIAELTEQYRQLLRSHQVQAEGIAQMLDVIREHTRFLTALNSDREQDEALTRDAIATLESVVERIEDR